MDANENKYGGDEEKQKLASAGLIVPNMPRPRFLLHATTDDELYSILGRLVTSKTLRKTIKSADPGLYAEMKSLLDKRRRAYNMEMTASENRREATCSGGDGKHF
uniref:Rubis-subs-bind domain-containing protein n=1 Tax=Ascaris lumbricoides TaxID=6252 RepID=A0A0M3I629_ASCLU